MIENVLKSLVLISILFACVVFVKSLCIHRLLSAVIENENGLLQKRKTLKPRCLQSVRGSFSASFLYVIGASLWLWKGDEINSDKFVLVISVILFMFTNLKNLGISQKVIEYSQLKRELKTDGECNGSD